MLPGILLGLVQAPAAGAPAAEPRARGWDEFPVFVWREKYAGKPLPAELAEPFGGVILMREEDSSWARERGLSYLVWNVAGRNALHLDADDAWNARVEEWIQTHDEKLLVREPCLNDPKTIEGLCRTLDATIAKHGEHPGLGFVLGDEVGLTPNGDPFDLCRCERCEAKWKEYAQARGLPERAPLTDEVRLALTEDDFSTLGAWLARRRFERQEFTAVLFGLAQHIRGLAFPPLCGPGSHGALPLGLLGIAGTTAFGALDLPALGRLDFFELYPVRDTRELQLALPELQPRAYASGTGGPTRGCITTIFVGDESPETAAEHVWEHWLRGGNALVLWNDARLEARPAASTAGEIVRRIRTTIAASSPRAADWPERRDRAGRRLDRRLPERSLLDGRPGRAAAPAQEITDRTRAASDAGRQPETGGAGLRPAGTPADAGTFQIPLPRERPQALT
jgi:hypothetical protein